MNIEEVISIYEFIASIDSHDFIGALCFVFAIGLVVAYTNDKIKKLIKARNGLFSISIIILIAAGITLFKLESDKRKKIRKNASYLKSEFVIGGYKEMTRDSVLQLENFKYTLNDDKDSIKSNDTLSKEDREKILDDILDTYPAQFIRVIDEHRSVNVRMIDPEALEVVNKYNRDHISLIKSRIVEYIVADPLRIMTYHQVHQEIDQDFDDEWLDLMMSTYDTIFAPTYNPRGREYDDKHGLRLLDSYLKKHKIPAAKE